MHSRPMKAMTKPPSLERLIVEDKKDSTPKEEEKLDLGEFLRKNIDILMFKPSDFHYD